MPTITGTAVLDKAAIILQDSAGVRWNKSTEMIGWLDDGQREIVLLKPEASIRNEAITLTASESKQSIPTGGIQFMKLTRNMGANGTTAGMPIRQVDQEVLDSVSPGWHSAVNTSGVIKGFSFDPRDPKHFYVSPRAGASAWTVEAVFSANPSSVLVPGVSLSSSTDKFSSTAHGLSDGDRVCFSTIGAAVATSGHSIAIDTTYFVVNKTTNDFQISATLGGSPVLFDTGGTVTYVGLISIDDIYANALIDYVLYRAYSKEADFAANAQIAAAHYAAMAGSLGVKSNNENLRNPNRNRQPSNPNVPVSA